MSRPVFWISATPDNRGWILLRDQPAGKVSEHFWRADAIRAGRAEALRIGGTFREPEPPGGSWSGGDSGGAA